jgi:hypothetical protein
VLVDNRALICLIVLARRMISGVHWLAGTEQDDLGAFCHWRTFWLLDPEVISEVI